MQNLPASPLAGAIAHPDADEPTGADSATGSSWWVFVQQPSDPQPYVAPARNYLGWISADGPIDALERWAAHATGVQRYLQCLAPSRLESNNGTLAWEVPPHTPVGADGEPLDYAVAYGITSDDVRMYVEPSGIVIGPQ